MKLLNSDNRAQIFVKLPIIKIYTVDFPPQKFFQLNLEWKYMNFAEKPAIVGLTGRYDRSWTCIVAHHRRGTSTDTIQTVDLFRISMTSGYFWNLRSAIHLK